MRRVPNGGPPVGLVAVFLCLALAGDRPRPADVSWAAGVPLWTSLSPAGKVIDAGPMATWASPPPAARLGPKPEPVALDGGAVPRTLPDALADPSPAPRRTVRPAGATTTIPAPAARLALPTH